MRPSTNLDSFGKIWKSSASIYESSGLQFLWTTSVAQPLPGNVDRSSLIITFFTNFWVTGVLCAFRLVPEEAVTSKDIPDPSRFDFWKSFQETMLLYQMQKAIPQGNLIEDVWFWTMCFFFFYRRLLEIQ